MQALLFSSEGVADIHGKADQYTRATGTYRVAQLIRNFGIDVNVVDFLQHWSEEEIYNFLKNQANNNIKIVGLNTTFLNDSFSKNFLFVIKQIFPDAKIIAGGQNPFVNNLYADYYVSGFAEKAINAIINHILYDKHIVAKKHFDGLLIDAVWGEYAAFPMKDYRTRFHESDVITSTDVTTIELSRGCKFACKYCSYPYIGNKIKNHRSFTNIRDELIENYERWGLTNYIIADDTLNESTDKLELLVKSVKGLSFKPTFASFVRLDLMRSHPEHIKLLAEARVLYHYYGVETFNHAAGKIIGKGLDPKYNKQTLLNTYNHFMDTVDDYTGTVGMIIGLPEESVESVEESYNWLKDEWYKRKQSVRWWPLIIPNDTLKLSAFGVELEKYKYIKLKDNEDDKLKNDILENPYFQQYYHKTSETPVLWKNNHMNFFKAVELADEYSKIWFNIPDNYNSLQLHANNYTKNNFDPYKFYDFIRHKANQYKEVKCSQ